MNPLPVCTTPIQCWAWQHPYALLWVVLASVGLMFLGYFLSKR